jgi:hypothetical protein
MAKGNFTLANCTSNLENKRMRKVMAAITAISVLLLPMPAHAAAPKAGAKCTKLNQSQSANGSKLTCVKSGGKLVWKKTNPSTTPTVRGVDFSKVHSTDNGYYSMFSAPCEFDPNIPAELAVVQNYFFDYSKCAGQLQLGKYFLGSKRPSTTFEPSSKYSSTEPCKIITPQNNRNNLGFTTSSPQRNEYAKTSRHPSPSTVLQLIPIYSNDTAQPVKTPAEDYKVFIDYFRNWIEYSSDFGSKVVFQVPSSYIKMETPQGGFQLNHSTRFDAPEIVRFNRALINAVDPIIDFSGVNIAIVVPPAGTESSLFGQTGIGALDTKEGRVPNAMSEFAALAKNPSQGTNLSHPFWWIHEMMHAGVGFDDHYGDGLRNINTEYGMGHLNLMTPWGGDLTTWEKWKLGFMQDSQVQCKTDSTVSMHWIAPSTVQTKESKAVVIPISSTKAVVIETLRPGGLYYKHPVRSQGVIAYEVDATQDKHGYGMKLSLPIGRTIEGSEVFMASAPLKQGESTINNGYKITVVESGTFGDVVRVEKA